MKIVLRIIFISVLCLAGYAGVAQVPAVQEENPELKAGQDPPASKSGKITSNADSDKRTENKGSRDESVKQVRSGKPDMTRTRGARPPDIVRPSGSRIPKGVGRPAGAGRHGR